MRSIQALAGFLALAASVHAQEVSGSIAGTVKDAGGAYIAGSEIAAVHSETGARRTTVTNTDGAYVFAALPIGTYAITASHSGFKKSVRAGIELHVSDHVSVDFALQVGDLTQEISVTADAAQVQIETSEQSGLISGEQVRELQLNGRSFMTLIELLPGVVSDMPDRVDPNTNPLLYINGARNSASSFNIDGGNNSDVIVGSGSLNTFTSVETIAEFKVITSTFAAEYGRGGTAQINVVTRGGTRNFHGSLLEFLRNDALDARDYFSHQVLPLKLNNFGYTIGGPVILPGYNHDRKKTFFFFTQEFNRISTRGEAVNTTVPNAAQRAGDFRGTNVIDPATSEVFPNGMIPASRMDANAVKLLKLYPLPNFQGPGAINYTSAAASRQNWREELFRIDQVISPSWKLYGRYAQDTANIFNPYGGSSVSAISTRFPGIAATNATRPGKNFTVNMTNVLSRTMLNELSLTYASRTITQEAIRDDANRAKLGIAIPEIFPENDGNLIPNITLNSNFAGLALSRAYLKRLFNTDLADNLTRIAGRHVFKVGAVYSYGGNRENPSGPATNGTYSFNTSFSRNAVSNMLLGLPNTYSEAEHAVVSHVRFGMLEAFAQDDLRAAARLMINIGVRYSAYFNPYDTDNVLTNFLPWRFDRARAPQINRSTGIPVSGTGQPLNGIVIAGKDSPYGRYITENNTNLLGPRAGFAWDPFGKKRTAVRGGYGIYFTRPLIGTYINNAFDNTPFSRTVTIQQPLFSQPCGGSQAPESAPALTALGTPMLAPTMQQWSFGLEHEIVRRAVLKVSYVGSHGTHLMRPVNLNDPLPGIALNNNPNVNAIRPYQGYGAITVRETSASSVYHSLQVAFNQRISRTLTLGASYTFARSIDNGSTERGGSDVPPNSRDQRAERGLSDFDRTHVFTANYIWNAPKLTRHRAAGALLNGWQISGITRFFSGKPFDVQLSTDVAAIGATQNQRPNLIADTRGPRTVEEWFNRNAFARPATGTFGNMGRNSLRGPGVNKWDLSLFKNFTIQEKVRAQFRTEFFNAFNHPSFTTIGTSLTTSATTVNPNANSFAVITNTRDARVLQFGLKLSF